MPLAHLLAPQLIRKAQEIEDAIGPARPMATGYLNAGYEKTPYDPQGLMDKPEQKSYDSRTSTEAQLMATVGQMQKSNDPNQQAMARGILKGLDATTVRPQLPNAAPPAGHPAPIGQDERGNAIYANAGDGAPRPPTKKGKTIIQLDPRAAVGTNERGEAVTARGVKQLGYLEKPAVATKLGERGEARTTGRGKKDIILQRDGSLRQDDAFGTAVVQREFKDDLAEVEGNRDANGAPTNKFPRGYLDNLTEKEKKAVIDGVSVLQKLERGQKI